LTYFISLSQIDSKVYVRSKYTPRLRDTNGTANVPAKTFW